jgi:hypothetical protein
MIFTHMPALQPALIASGALFGVFFCASRNLIKRERPTSPQD